MSGEKQKLIGRYERLAFMETADGTFTRMTGFSSMSNSKNSKEYNRHYVDEKSDRTDVVGYAASTSYSFDRHTNNPVHEKISKIADEEVLGTDAQVNIVVVDLFTEASGKCTARKRTYSVIPDTDSDGTDALVYSGSFKAAGDQIIGTAASTDGWKTCTFTEGTGK